MNLKQKILSYTLTAGMALSAGFSCAFPVKKELSDLSQHYNPVDKYAVLVCGMSGCNTQYNENVPEIDKNCESITLFRLYEHLSKAGFKDKNIRMLYSTKERDPNFDAGNPDIAQRVKKNHFSGQYNTDASESNIEDLLEKFKKKADSNDKVVFYLSAHGDPLGNIFLEDVRSDEWPEFIRPREFQKYLDGWKSKSNWFMIMNCYGGSTLDAVDVDNVCLFSATQSRTQNWVDINWDGGVEFLKHKLDKKNDANRDGIVDYDEATNAVKKSAAHYWTSFLRDFLQYEYEGGTEYPDETNLQPKLKVGKNFKKVNLK